jgi:hypothetical protein
MVKLIINESQLELFQNTDFPLSLNRALVDFKELGSRSGEFSLTVKVPNSESNRRALEYYDNLTESNKFRKGIDNRCLVIANNVIIVIGLFFITSVSDNEISGYILARTSSLSKLLDTLKLRDLVGLEFEFEGLPTIQENLAYHAANGASPEKLVLFGMVGYGNYFIANRWDKSPAFPVTRYDSSQYGNKVVRPREILGNTEYFLNDNSNTQLDFRSLPPQVYVVALLKAMFRQIGYRVTGSWVNGQEARRLLMLFTGEEAYQYNYENLIDSEFESEGLINGRVLAFIRYNWDDDEYQVPESTQIQIKSNNVDFPTGAINTAVNELGTWFTIINLCPVETIIIDNTFSLGQNTFIAPTAGSYKIEYTFQIDDIDTHSFSGNRVFRKGFGISKFSGSFPSNLDGFSTLWQTIQFGTPCVHFVPLLNANIGDVFSDNGNLIIDLEVGDVLVFWFSTTMYNRFTGFRPLTTPISFPDLPPFLNAFFAGNFDPLDGSWDNDNFIESKIEFINTNFKITMVGTNPNVNIAPNLPDVSCLDFTKSLVNLFNLYLNVDDLSKTVYIDSFKDFYLGNDLAVDITNRTQLESVEVAPSDMASSYLFQWIADDDDIITRKVYDYQYRSKIDVPELENIIDSGIFCSTEIVNFDGVTDANNDFLNPNYQSAWTIALPRLVSDANVDNLSNEILEDRTNFKPRLLWFDSVEVAIPTPIMHSGVNTTQSLVGIVNFSFRSFKELFFDYYKNYLNGLANGYELSLSLSLNEFLWNEMQINKPILYEKVVYCIKEIKGYRPDGKNLTKITLFRCK